MKVLSALFFAGSVLACTLASTPALAVKAFSLAHLHIRSGPGEQFPIVGELRWNRQGEVDVCTPDYVWCHLSTANGIGWAAAYYLNEGGGSGTIADLGPQSGIPVMGAAVAVVGAVTPAGEYVEAITPTADVIAYVQAAPVAAVNVTGEIVVGVVLPAELILYEVPNAPYQYAVVNGATVLVEPATRKIVYIV
jgi:uncharacterized protein YraI